MCSSDLVSSKLSHGRPNGVLDRDNLFPGRGFGEGQHLHDSLVRTDDAAELATTDGAALVVTDRQVTSTLTSPQPADPLISAVFGMAFGLLRRQGEGSQTDESDLAARRCGDGPGRLLEAPVAITFE